MLDLVFASNGVLDLIIKETGAISIFSSQFLNTCVDAVILLRNLRLLLLHLRRSKFVILYSEPTTVISEPRRIVVSI